jgi:FKBP-type peptidyl-prolyl cis-trans isomerase (trigger factor)
MSEDSNSDTRPPIDPSECELVLDRVAPELAKLRIKVPAALVRRFRKKMRQSGHKASPDELQSALTQFCISHGIKGQDIRMITPPSWAGSDGKAQASIDKDFEGVVELDLAVPLAVADIKGILIEAPDYVVTEEMVEAEVASQCRQFGTRSPGDAAERGSECVVDIEFRVGDGERPVLAREGVVVSIPEAGELLLVDTLQVPDIASELCGARAGDVRAIKGTFPTNLPNALLQSRPALITVKFREVRKVEPALVSQVLSEYGMPSEARLRTQIRFALDDKRERDAKALLREQAADCVLAKFSIGVPIVRGRMLRAAVERQLLAALAMRGLSDDAAKAEYERALPEAHALADRQGRLYGIIRSIAPELALVLDEDFVAGRVAAAAVEQGKRPETLRAELVKSGRFNQFIDEMTNGLALDKIIAMADVRRVPVAEWEARKKHVKPWAAHA